jgi:hypothetical protein
VNTQDPNSHEQHWRTPPGRPVGGANYASGLGPGMQSHSLPQPHMPNMYASGWPQQAYPYPQPVPPQRRSNAKVMGIVALAVLVVGLLVIVGVALHSSGSSPAAGGGTNTSAPVAAVCQPGSYKHPGQEATPSFGDATDIAVCTGKIAWTADPPDRPGEEYGPIWIIQFASLDAARDEVAEGQLAGATAIATIDGKTVLFFAPADMTGVSLQPLTQFGFTVKPAR